MLLIFVEAAPAQVNPDELNTGLIKKSTRQVLGWTAPIKWHAIAIPDSVKKELQNKFKTDAAAADTLFLGALTQDGEQIYVVPDIAPSRSEKFSYVIYLSEKKQIIGVDVLIYRESYGFEIDYDFFRGQFTGKQQAGDVIFGRTIQNISGATISARSITYSIHDLLLILNQLSLP